MEKELQNIKLYDEAGNEKNLKVIDFFDVVNPDNDEKCEYVIVEDEAYPDENPFALKVTKDEDGEEIFELIDNEVELAAVEEAYNTIFIDE